MNKAFNELHKHGGAVFRVIRKLSVGVGLVAYLMAANYCSAETLVASDMAANYSGFSGNQGIGFGAWVVTSPGGGTLMGTVATTITNSTPGSTKVWQLWNSTVGSATTARRPFNAALEVGGKFTTTIRVGNLNVAGQAAESTPEPD